VSVVNTNTATPVVEFGTRAGCGRPALNFLHEETTMSNFIPKAIETEYNGYKFRSRLEARWAVVFDWLKVKYQYEPQGFELEDGLRYLPDFYLPEHKLYVEIKADANAAIASGDKLKRFADMVRANGQYYAVFYDVPHYEACVYEKYKYQSIEFEHSKPVGLTLKPVLRKRALNNIEYERFSANGTLNCARCNDDFTHLEKIEPYTYDDRMAVKLSFTCEACSERDHKGGFDEIAFFIEIENHSGHTYIEQSYMYTENNQLLILSGCDYQLLEDALYAGRTARFEHGQQPLTMQLPSKNGNSQLQQFTSIHRRR
jgi:hypothetical protein